MSTTPACLVDLQPQGAGRPFFFLHPVSGSVSRYYDLARRLGDDRPFLGIQSAGFDGRERPLTRVQQMAARYAAEIAAKQPDEAILIGGWSFGGIVAYETACQLEAAGRDVALLAIVDAKAPGLLAIERRDPIDLLVDLFPQELGPIDGDLRRADRDDRLALAYERVLQAARVPSGFDLSSFRTYFDIYEANCESLHHYRPEPCRLSATVFRASEDLAREPYAPALGWDALARGDVDVIPVPGNHASLVSEPHVAVLAERLRSAIQRADGCATASRSAAGA